MSDLVQVILGGMLAVVAFDVAACLASRRLGFPYVLAAPGSFLIYAGIGYFAARAGAAVPDAALAAAYVSLFDAMVGLAIIRAIGPAGLPDEVTPAEWVAGGVVAIMMAAAAGALGAAAA